MAQPIVQKKNLFVPQTPVPRELWEKRMLTLALNSLTDNGNGQKKGIFAHKYLAIHDLESDTLSIEDTVVKRGIIYQAKRGKPSTINNLTDNERSMFALPLEMNSQTEEQKQIQR